MPLPPGMQLGPYEILAPLGAGGMGEVYRARDSRLARDVAIKIPYEIRAAQPGLRSIPATCRHLRPPRSRLAGAPPSPLPRWKMARTHLERHLRYQSLAPIYCRRENASDHRFRRRRTFIPRRVAWSPDNRFIFAAVGEGYADIVFFEGLLR